MTVIQLRDGKSHSNKYKAKSGNRPYFQVYTCTQLNVPDERLIGNPSAEMISPTPFIVKRFELLTARYLKVI